MRALVISPEQVERVNDLVGYVSRRENWYRPGESDFVPGDRPEYSIDLNTYRCVFSITELPIDGIMFRNLSVSVPVAGKLPNEIAVWNIAVLFGFTGAKKADGTDIVVGAGCDWTIGVDEKANCVVIAQSYEVSLLDYFPNAQVFTIDIGERVICDLCGEEWTERPESGGIAFCSKACCPTCAPKVETDAVADNETRFIRGRCPADLSFADWVRTVLRAKP